MPLKLGTSNEAPQGTPDRTQGSLATRYWVVDTRPYQHLKLIFGRKPDAEAEIESSRISSLDRL